MDWGYNHVNVNTMSFTRARGQQHTVPVHAWDHVRPHMQHTHVAIGHCSSMWCELATICCIAVWIPVQLQKVTIIGKLEDSDAP